jgi:tRNA (cytidine/uridine-2'-O-)-methyltransferase
MEKVSQESAQSLFHVVLYRPEIPQNTGNIGRLCALTRTRLHLIHPLGFSITDRHLRRSGMDYWYSLDLHQHADWQSFMQSPERPKRLWLFTTKATRSYWDATFEPGDGLLFGQESAGCPPDIHQQVGDDHCITIPHTNPQLRSHNLSNCAAVGLYEAIRQATVAGWR